MRCLNGFQWMQYEKRIYRLAGGDHRKQIINDLKKPKLLTALGKTLSETLDSKRSCGGRRGGGERRRGKRKICDKLVDFSELSCCFLKFLVLLIILLVKVYVTYSIKKLFWKVLPQESICNRVLSFAKSQPYTGWKLSVFGVFLAHIFLDSKWIQRDTPYPSVLSQHMGKHGE